MTEAPQVTGPKLITKKAVLAKYPVSPATLDKRVAAGTFPSPVILGDRSVAWFEHEVDAALEALPRGRCSLRVAGDG